MGSYVLLSWSEAHQSHYCMSSKTDSLLGLHGVLRSIDFPRTLQFKKGGGGVVKWIQPQVDFWTTQTVHQST